MQLIAIILPLLNFSSTQPLSILNVQDNNFFICLTSIHAYRVYTPYNTKMCHFSICSSKFIALKCNFSMNKRRLGDFFGVQCTLHQNKPLLTFLFCEVFHVIANYRTYSAVNRVHYNYGVIRCFIRVLLRKCQLFHRFTIPAIQSAKIEYLAPKIKTAFKKRGFLCGYKPLLPARVSRRCFHFVQAIAFDSRQPSKGFIFLLILSPCFFLFIRLLLCF